MNLKLVKEIIEKLRDNTYKKYISTKEEQKIARDKLPIYQPRGYIEGYYKGLSEAYNDVLELMEEEENESRTIR